ncbi:hypothetical protein GCM10022206_80670 [Streptomyces chiangmaiensis]
MRRRPLTRRRIAVHGVAGAHRRGFGTDVTGMLTGHRDGYPAQKVLVLTRHPFGVTEREVVRSW